MADPVTLLKVLVLITVANAAPVVAGKLLGSRFDAALDGGAQFFDARPLFGASKTIRGVIVSVAATGIAAELLGFDWTLGAALAAAAMVGDLATSFVKRRLAMPIHGRATGLDQVPEAALPLLVLQGRLGLGLVDIGVLGGLFAAVALLGSRALFQLGVKDRPY